MKTLTQIYQKGYTTLLFLGIILIPSIFLNKYSLIENNDKHFVILREVYDSLYNSSFTINVVLISAIVIPVLLMTIGKRLSSKNSRHYVNLFLSALYEYVIQIWLAFFDLFAYIGKLNYIFPNMKNGNYVGYGLGFAILNLAIGLIFILLVLEPPIQAK